MATPMKETTMERAMDASGFGSKIGTLGSILGLTLAAALPIGCSSNDHAGRGGSAGDTGGSNAAGGSTEQGGSAGQGGSPGAGGMAVANGGGGANPGSGGSSGQHQIKWNPGHYLASDSIVYAGGSIFASEMDHLDHQPAMVGYRMFVTWSVIEPTKGDYHFEVVGAALARLKTQYDVPKRLVLVVLPGGFTRTAPGANDGSILPLYLQESSEYGPSPVAGRYGWWGGTGNGNTYAAALHRPAVMDRWTALHQALGAKYDSDPNFEAIMFQEDSWSIGASSTNHCPDYDDDSMITNYHSLLTATVAAFPHTNVIFENTWCGHPTATQELEQWMVDHRVAPGTADTYGQTYVDEHDGHLNSWGLDAFQGMTVDGSDWHGPDLRTKARAMLDVEGPDLGAYGGKPFTPADIIKAANESYKASHLFWTYLEANSKPDAEALWPALVQTCTENPLTNIGYPENYP